MPSTTPCSVTPSNSNCALSTIPCLKTVATRTAVIATIEMISSVSAARIETFTSRSASVTAVPPIARARTTWKAVLVAPSQPSRTRNCPKNWPDPAITTIAITA